MTINNFKSKSSIAKYLLQTSLFSASTKYDDVNYIRERYYTTLDGFEFCVHGESLTQFDLAVSIAFKKILNSVGSLTEFEFSLTNFSRALNRIDGGRTRDYIYSALCKAGNNYFQLYYGRDLKFEGSRLTHLSQIANNKFIASLNLNYLSFAYRNDSVCSINFDTFLKLPLGLCSWLYGFICSSPLLKGLDVDTLHDLSGSNYKSQYDFRKAVKKALLNLEGQQVINRCWGVTRDGVAFWSFKEQ